jgi:hypothetical protein
MNTCSQFNHPEARQMCYAVQTGQLGDAQAKAELDAMEPAVSQAPKDEVNLGRMHPEAAEYFYHADRLRAAALGQTA